MLGADIGEVDGTGRHVCPAARVLAEDALPAVEPLRHVGEEAGAVVADAHPEVRERAGRDRAEGRKKRQEGRVRLAADDHAAAPLQEGKEGRALRGEGVLVVVGRQVEDVGCVEDGIGEVEVRVGAEGEAGRLEARGDLDRVPVVQRVDALEVGDAVGLGPGDAELAVEPGVEALQEARRRRHEALAVVEVRIERREHQAATARRTAVEEEDAGAVVEDEDGLRGGVRPVGAAPVPDHVGEGDRLGDRVVRLGEADLGSAALLPPQPVADAARPPIEVDDVDPVRVTLEEDDEEATGADIVVELAGVGGDALAVHRVGHDDGGVLAQVPRREVLEVDEVVEVVGEILEAAELGVVAAVQVGDARAHGASAAGWP